ncbi:MAG: hypothetical protein ABW019_08950 [Chitinophagaceae bacterium]
MRKLYLFIILLYTVPLYSQVVTVNDFITLTSLQDKRINGYIAKMGFVQVPRTLDDGTLVNEFFYRNKKDPFDTTVRFLSGYRSNGTTGVSYLTSSFTESRAVLREFRLNGFTSGSADTTMKTDSMLIADSIAADTVNSLQKEDMTLKLSEEMRDEIRMYKILLEKKPAPASSALRFANDLLFFSSHESLVTKFGEGNVEKNMYYFSQTDSSRCSVLYPASNRQAIFIWDDQANYRSLAYVMIGGGLRADKPADQDRTVGLNAWKCNSGLFTGMRLSEVVRINGGDFSFFGNASEFAMMAAPEKKGNIDFSKTGIVLGCFNCQGSPLIRTEKISAESAIAAGLQLYIVSIVLLP